VSTIYSGGIKSDWCLLKTLWTSLHAPGGGQDVLALEGRHRLRCNSRRWEDVPDGYCSNVDGVPIGYGGRLDVLVFQGVSSASVSRCRCDNGRKRYLHKAHLYSEEHCGVLQLAASVERVPANVAEHLSNAGASAVVAFHEACCCPLDTLQTLFVLSGMWGPGSSGILQFGADEDFIGCFLDLRRAAVKVSADEA